MNGVNNGSKRSNNDASWSERFVRPGSVDKCKCRRDSEYRLHDDYELTDGQVRLLRAVIISGIIYDQGAALT